MTRVLHSLLGGLLLLGLTACNQKSPEDRPTVVQSSPGGRISSPESKPSGLLPSDSPSLHKQPSSSRHLIGHDPKI